MGINDFPGSRVPKSNEQKAVVNKERILSDAEALKNGAEVDANGKVEFTEKQKSDARREMLSGIDPEFKSQEALLNTITKILKVLHAASLFPADLSVKESMTRQALEIVQQYEVSHEHIEGISQKLSEILKLFDELNDRWMGDKRKRGTEYSISHKFGEVEYILESRGRDIKNKIATEAKAA